MEKYRQPSLLFSGLILILFFASCKTDVNINDHFNQSIPLKMKITERDSSTGFSRIKEFAIPVNSANYQSLIQWGNKNVSGWTETPASFISDIYIGQNDFRLLIISKGNEIVVGFTDKNGSPKQFTKSIDRDELTFLQSKKN